MIEIPKRLINFISSTSKKKVIIWFILSLFVAVFYGYLGLQAGYSSEFVVQDDGRHHVFWTFRYLDPELFPNDIVADYFQSLAPAGYRLLYYLSATVGIHPLDFHKILPVVLGSIATGYGFGICLEIIPIPITGFIATLLLNQHLWMEDNLSSGTPRAFFAPLLLAFLYYFLKRSIWGCLIVIALQGFLYPSCVLISSGLMILWLFQWRNGKLHLSSKHQDYILSGIGLFVAFLVLLPYVLIDSEFGSMVDVATAKTMAEFQADGRNNFFDPNPWYFWLGGGRSGIFTETFVKPPTLVAGLFLPMLMAFPRRFQLAKQIKPSVRVLLLLILTGFGLFFLAHLTLFLIYLPSRYTQYNFPLVFVLAGAIALTILLDTSLRWARHNHIVAKILTLTFVGAVTIYLLFYPTFLNQFPQASYFSGEPASLYGFFAQQPQDIVVASLTSIADNIPSFSERSVLFSRETALAYHPEYYSVIQQRVNDLIQAQYSPNLADIQQVIQTHDFNFWVIDQNHFTAEYLQDNDWLQQFQPATEIAETNLQQGQTPAILNTVEACAVWQENKLAVLDTQCLLQQ